MNSMDIVKENREYLCQYDIPFYAILPFEDSMMSTKRYCDKLGGRVPILTDSPELRQDLLRITRETFGQHYGEYKNM